MSADSAKPKEEKQPLTLSNELSNAKQDLVGSSPEDPKEDVSAEMSELKRRMNKSEVELKAMTDAMKGTLLDLRTLMQDVDNPFNLLRNMGVDKLVNGAVEQVEDELNKAKREEAKKRMAEEPKDPDRIVSLGGQAPVMMGGAAPQAAPLVAPQAVPQTMPAVAPMAAPIPVASPAPQVAPPTGQTHMMAPYAGMPTTIQALPMEVNQIKERMGRNENVLKELTVTLSTLIDDLKDIVAEQSNKEDDDEEVLYDIQRGKGKKSRLPSLAEGVEEGESGVYYEAFVSLIGEYLVLRFGQAQAQQILMEGLYKGWTSPRVVRDVIDAVRSKPRKLDEPEPTLDFGTSYFSNVRIEDKILITTLMKNLDKPMSPQEEPTQLFLLLALVSKARDGEPHRA